MMPAAAAALLALSGASPSAPPPPPPAARCSFALGFAPSCAQYDFCAAANKSAAYRLNDTYGGDPRGPQADPYLVAAPFAVAPTADCPACSALPGAAGYQFAPQHYCTERCLSLGYPQQAEVEPLDAASPAQGVRITFHGGSGGRSLIHEVHCKPGAELTPRFPMQEGPYKVTWDGAEGCATAASGSACPTAPPLAKPTAAQLAWQEMEVGALIHFNMATYGTCHADPSAFNPTKLDTDQWVQSFSSFGVKEAVLVAKHGCGFTTWPSTAKLSDGSRYNYSVAFSKWEQGKGDVVASFKASCLKAGIGVGYYYSLGSNGQFHGTAEELQQLELQQLTELWTTYGNGGNLTEIWFDGGFEGPLEPKIREMLAKMQPNAMAFNGCVVKGGPQNKSTCITPNALRWIGTEAGVAPDPTWSTGFNKGGDPNSDMFCPGESDTTLQNGDQWFYNAKIGIRTLAELQDVYHGTVGHNSFLMMDFAPTPDGLIAPDQVARYKEFGDWQRDCYDGAGQRGIVEYEVGSSKLDTVSATGGARRALELRWAAPQTIDRVVLREDQTAGQAIRGWSVQAQLASDDALGKDAEWVVLVNGTAVGNKWISLLPINYSVSALRAEVTASHPGSTPKLRSVSGHLCPRAGKSAQQCKVQENFAANGVGPTVLHGKTVGECCAACAAKKGCAVAVFMETNVPTCTLYTASSVGGKTIQGAVTLSPPGATQF